MKILPFIKQHKWLLLIILLGAVLRLIRLTHASLWVDEIFTMNVTSPKLTFSEFYHEIVTREGFPFLYFLLVKAFYVILGYSEFAARLVSALGGIAGIIATYKLGKHLFTKEAGLIAALLVTVNEFHIYHSQDARPYTLFYLFAIIAFLRLSIFIKVPTLKNALWYGLAAGLLLNINFFAIIIVLTQALLLLLVIGFSQKQDRLKTIWRSALAGLIALIMFIPNYEILIKLMEFKVFWVPAPQPDSLTIMLKQLLGSYETTLFLFGFIFTFYIVTVFRKQDTWTSIETVKDQPQSYSFIILIFWIVIFTTYIYIKSYREISVMVPRYFIGILPAILLMLGMGIAMIRNSIVKKALIVLIVFLSLVNLVAIRQFYKFGQKTQFKEVSAFIANSNNNKAPVYSQMKYFYDFYLNNDTIKTEVYQATLEEFVTMMKAVPKLRRPFWYADAHGNPYKLSPEAEQTLLRYFKQETAIDKLDAWARYYTPKTEKVGNIDLKKFGELKAVNGDLAFSIVEQLSYANNMLTVSGWAYLTGGEATDTKVQLVLMKDGAYWAVPVQKTERKDVAEYYKVPYNIDNCGFTINEDINMLEPGTYQVGVYLINKTLNKESLLITDKLLHKTN